MTYLEIKLNGMHPKTFQATGQEVWDLLDPQGTLVPGSTTLANGHVSIIRRIADACKYRVEFSGPNVIFTAYPIKKVP